ncbi:hypothetical protein QUB30_03570 [Microcoleus sp. BROC3]
MVGCAISTLLPGKIGLVRHQHRPNKASILKNLIWDFLEVFAIGKQVRLTQLGYEFSGSR